jgi:hypothetical protein
MKNSVKNKTIFIGLLIAFFLTGQFLISYCQEIKKDSGIIKIIQDDKVDLLVSKHIRINQGSQGIDGYRIQIFFDSGNNSKTNAKGVYESFIAKFPDVKAYLSFKTPNYKVRVGDFRTKLDAQRFLNEILTDYPNAWITADQINLPDVKP